MVTDGPLISVVSVASPSGLPWPQLGVPQPGGAKKSQEEPGGVRRSKEGRMQKEPGGARRSQEEPKGAIGAFEGEPAGARMG